MKSPVKPNVNTLMTPNLFSPQQLRPSRRIALAVAAILCSLFASLGAHAQTGPFSPTNWPGTIDTNSTADYLIVDPSAVFDTPASWNATITFAGGGDQDFISASLDGLTGDQSTSAFMNIADANYTQFGNTPIVDILLEVPWLVHP
jgi:hypothetical protein